MSEDAKEKSDFTRGDRSLLLSFALGPLAVLTNLTVSYALVPTACTQRSKLMLHWCALAFIVVAALGGWIALHHYRKSEPVDGLTSRERTQWVAIVAMVLAVASIVVIIAMEIPNFMLGSCD